MRVQCPQNCMADNFLVSNPAPGLIQ